MANNLIEKVYVQIGGEIINIQDLPPDQFEYFMELMNQTRIAYISLVESKKQNNKAD